MSETIETFQIPLRIAEAYEATFVPALFAGWARDLVEAAEITAGQRVLDVACGTGIVARTAADRAGATPQMVGLDLNEAMLTVADRVRPDIEWRLGDAADLPFDDDAFDVVTCQAALMFFADRVQALREMARVVTADGTVAVHVPGRLAASDAYVALIEIAARHAGPDAVNLLSAYFALGDTGELRRLFAESGLDVVDIKTRMSTLDLGSVDQFVAAEVESTPLIERISDEVYTRIREDARVALEPFTAPSGAVAIPIEGHAVSGCRRRRS